MAESSGNGFPEMLNRRPFRHGSGCSGVRLKEGRWVARIQIDGKRVSLGGFDTVEQANEAYRLAREGHS